MQERWRWCAPGLLVAVFGLIGCGPGNGLTLGRVHGKVTYKGEPVNYGTVSFVPDSTKGTNGPIAMGNILSDGTFVLSTSDAGDGAIVGHHKVSIVGLDPSPVTKADEKPAPSPEESPLEVMKARMKGLQQARRAQSRNTAAISKAEGDTFTDRGGRVFRYVTPKNLGSAEDSGITVEVLTGSNQIDLNIDDEGKVKVGR